MKPNESKIKEDLRGAISAFCRWRVHQNMCETDECCFCPVNDVYDMAGETNESFNDTE